MKTLTRKFRQGAVPRNECGGLLLSLYHRFLKLFAGAEPHGFCGGYPDSLRSVRIVTASCLSMGNRKCAKPNQGYLVVLAQTIGNGLFHCVDSSLCLGLADRRALCNFLDQIALIHCTSKISYSVMAMSPRYSVTFAR